jgi:hypothetical protein
MNVQVIIDGQELDLNDFVKKITINVASGIVESLRDVPDWKNLTIKIEK